MILHIDKNYVYILIVFEIQYAWQLQYNTIHHFLQVNPRGVSFVCLERTESFSIVVLSFAKGTPLDESLRLALGADDVS